MRLWKLALILTKQEIPRKIIRDWQQLGYDGRRVKVNNQTGIVEPEREPRRI